MITMKDLVALRPAPSGSISTMEIDDLVGSTLTSDIEKGEYLSWKNTRQ